MNLEMLSATRAVHKALEAGAGVFGFFWETALLAAEEIAFEGFDSGQRDGYDEEGRRSQPA